jgi:NAD-dependent dihydropyrimidine dehydrogenase PreA subunit
MNNSTLTSDPISAPPATPSANRPLYVVLSRGQSQNPVKRQLEDDLIAEVANQTGRQVLVIPNLYDLVPDGPSLTTLNQLPGDLIVLAWHFSRSTHWILDRHGIAGQIGEVELQPEEEGDEEAEESASAEEEKERVIDTRNPPERTIYSLDLRLKKEVGPFVREIIRIALARQQRPDLLQWIQGNPTADQLAAYLANPANLAAVHGSSSEQANGNGTTADNLEIAEEAGRRWYPVIDYSRCTNCMECIDFCLFGVYGVDRSETLLVEQPDNCRKGCPACSRVCPENAIIFPQHKTPTIAGAPAVGGSLKIDLSQLFGAPDAIEVAAMERDEQLVAAGREAVGLEVGIPKRQVDKPSGPADELDALIDNLDDLDI